MSDDGQRRLHRRSTARPAATRGSPSRTTPARPGRRRSSSTANRYYFAFDADVAPTGPSTSPSRASSTAVAATRARCRPAPIDDHVFVSTRPGRDVDRTASSRSVQPGIACVAAGCPPDFYLGHTRAVGRRLRQRRRTSTTARRRPAAPDRGREALDRRGATWSAPVTLSAAGEKSVDPAVESRGNGDVRAWYYQTSGGGNVDAWNVWYRSLDRRRGDVGGAGQDLRRHGRRRVQDAGRLRRGLRRLRRDRDHEHRQDDRALGRGRELRPARAASGSTARTDRRS